MSVQPLRIPEPQRGSSPATQRGTESRVAVLLNANARRVSEKVVRSLSHVVPHEDLFVSRSMMDARRIAQTVLERRYSTVFTGGGDGTFMGFVNEILRQLEIRNQYHHQKAPRFGVLKLGTGNAIASCVNASSLKGDRILDDVLRARAGEVPGYRDLDLLTVDGKRAHFAGTGVDGKMLNDALWAKNLGAGPAKAMFSGAGAYFWGIALKTAPHYLSGSAMVDAEVINTAKTPAYRLDANGAVAGEVAPGEVMHRGRLMMASASTIPFYGYDFKMFPFAGQRRGTFQLRLASVNTVQVLSNLRKLWNGRWFNDQIHDFHATNVKVKFSRPMPLQVGGDAEGYRDELVFGMAPDRLELVDFTGAVH